MMNQQPDNFFREKLEGFHKAAPAGAWNRIEAKLEKKNSIAGWWWKIAASLLLIATISYWLLPKSEISSKQFSAQSKTEPSISEPKSEKIVPQEIPNQIANDFDNTSRKISAEPKKVLSKKNKNVKIKSEPTHEEKQISVNRSQKKEDLNSIIQDNESVIPLESIHEPTSKLKTITLKVTVEESNQYLNKNTLAQATSEKKKSSTFKKLLKKANELKSNQDPFGDLREKKNEILALNFKNEKRGQNK